MKTIRSSLVVVCLFAILSNAFAENNLAKFDVAVNNSDSSVSISNKSKNDALNYQINFGDGTVLSNEFLKDYSHKYIDTGVYTICLVVKDSLKKKIILDTLCQTVEIKAAASCNAIFQYVILNNEVAFTNTSTGDYKNASWTFGDGAMSSKKDEVTHKYLKSGYYTVSLAVANRKTDCKSEISQTILVQNTAQECIALFQYALLTSRKIAFKNKSIGNFDQLSWDFGDGTLSNEDSVEHEFANPGKYKVKLLIENMVTKRKSVFTENIDIEKDSIDLLPFFTYEINSSSDTIVFVNKTIGNNIKSYIWSFGDGSISLDSLPSHTYATSGNYFVCLNVLPKNGKIQSTCQNIIAGMDYSFIPEMSFSIENKEVSFSLTYNIQPDSVVWDFSNGSYSKEIEPRHLFKKNDVYLIGLKLYYGTIQKEVLQIINLTENKSKVLGRFKMDNGKKSLLKAVGGKIKFRGTLSGDVSRLRFLWDFGDGAFDSTSIETDHIYAHDGKYNVCFTVVNDLTGDSDSWCDSLQVGNIANIGIIDNVPFQFSVFPNPASKIIHIELQSLGSKDVSICISDMAGREIAQLFNGNSGIGIRKLSLPVSVSKGVYFISCKMNKYKLSKLILIN